MRQTDISLPVIRNDDLGHGNHLVELRDSAMAGGTRPGQFFMVGVPGGEVLLRRPFSVCALPGTFAGGQDDAFHLLYRVIGRGTSILASLAPGARVEVLGPLGNGFDPPADPRSQPVFVAGGIGSAPFPALAADLLARGFRPRMFYGARSSGDLPLLDHFRERLPEVVVTTEDGSSGLHGLVTDPLEQALAEGGGERLHLYACGPVPMLRAVARLALDSGVRCDLSLEAPMACGFGVCLGCVVPVRGDHEGEVRLERVCVEGPVMPAERLAW